MHSFSYAMSRKISHYTKTMQLNFMLNGSRNV